MFFNRSYPLPENYSRGGSVRCSQLNSQIRPPEKIQNKKLLQTVAGATLVAPAIHFNPCIRRFRVGFIDHEMDRLRMAHSARLRGDTNNNACSAIAELAGEQDSG